MYSATCCLEVYQIGLQMKELYQILLRSFHCYLVQSLTGQPHLQNPQELYRYLDPLGSCRSLDLSGSFRSPDQ